MGLVAVAVIFPLVRWSRRDLAAILGRRRVAVTVAAASLGTSACHAAVLLAAMASTGVDLPVQQRLALALVVLLGSAVPTNVAGWGPREGAAAWAFVAVGLPASDGLAVSVAYGVAALVATLPGALALLLIRMLRVRREASVG
jgi:glycosyltransferase 2 family protein